MFHHFQVFLERNQDRISLSRSDQRSLKLVLSSTYITEVSAKCGNEGKGSESVLLSYSALCTLSRIDGT